MGMVQLIRVPAAPVANAGRGAVVIDLVDAKARITVKPRGRPRHVGHGAGGARRPGRGVIPAGVEVFVGHEPIDLRWDFDRLAGLERFVRFRSPGRGPKRRTA